MGGQAAAAERSGRLTDEKGGWGGGARFVACHEGEVNDDVVERELEAKCDVFGDGKEADAGGVAG